MNYTPYGEKIKSASTGPDIFHQKYTGQVDDGEETGLMYYNARYYDPMIGRFISADTVIPDAGFSQSFNRYMYVAGNPVNFNDPSGHFKFRNILHKICDNVTSAKWWGNVIKTVSGYKDGGWRGVFATVTSITIHAIVAAATFGIINVSYSYSYTNGWGVRFGGSLFGWQSGIQYDLASKK